MTADFGAVEGAVNVFSLLICSASQNFQFFLATANILTKNNITPEELQFSNIITAVKTNRENNS